LNTALEKMADALKSIARYIENKKPKTMPEAEHMLALISVIASETLDETKEATSCRKSMSTWTGRWST
jgi:hypothetical protein